MKELTQDQISELNKRNEADETALSPFAARDRDAVRLFESKRYAEPDPLRSQYAMDADRIINCKQFNHGGDKTQVFSFYENDEITRRASHVQLVSRIARKIGKALRLNLDLIEAIAIGHDIGHTPFGHAGERILSELYFSHCEKYFNHNVHSVRVLNFILHNNLTIQTLDGILCHCGEEVHERYEPSKPPAPTEFYEILDKCYTENGFIKTLRPSTLEGCVVRLSDMIAYIGKDRQDADILGFNVQYDDTVIGKENREIIENVTRDVISNSMGKRYLSLSRDVFEALDRCKTENNEKIYKRPEILAPYNDVIKPMAEKLFDAFVNDVNSNNTRSLVYKHYLDDTMYRENYFERKAERMSAEPADIAVDFIASMTDDYFLAAYKRMFPDDPLNDKIRYTGYFD